jgi:sugar lactone lactonase YvrE
VWIAGFGTATGIAELSAAQLAAGTSSAATTALGTGSGSFLGIAFDQNGNLWAAKFNADSIYEFSAAQLGAGGSPSPVVALSGSAITFPSGLAFDGNGTLWVASANNNTVVGFSASQLASGGSPAPAVIISSADSSLNEPLDMAFDASGDMWVVSRRRLVEYTPSQLAASGSPVPAVTIGDDGSNSLNAPSGEAIDAAGGVWVANGNGGPVSVVGYTKNQLTASGIPVPHVILTPNGSSMENPGGIGFDASGDLWVANVGFGAPPLVEFVPNQFVSSGSPVPTITVTSSSLFMPWGLAFNPHASGLPIKP